MADRRDPPARGARAGMQNPVLKVTAISADDLALLLSKSGGKAVSRDTIRTHVDAGAPVNADGTLNLVHYAAWLARELSGHGD